MIIMGVQWQQKTEADNTLKCCGWYITRRQISRAALYTIKTAMLIYNGLQFDSRCDPREILTLNGQ